jgi:hypothetical protein
MLTAATGGSGGLLSTQRPGCGACRDLTLRDPDSDRIRLPALPIGSTDRPIQFQRGIASREETKT